MPGSRGMFSALLLMGLGLLLILFGVLGINFYQQSTQNPDRPIWEQPAITMKNASFMMMPIGFLGGAGCIVWGVIRLRNDDDNMPEEEVA